MSYLFGNILLITKGDLINMAILNLFIIAFVIISYKKLQMILFDREFAAIAGIRVDLYYMVLLCLVALVVVLLVSVVGIIMVVALLTLPAAVGSFFSKKLWQMMLWSVFICMLFSSTGIFIAYESDLPTGPMIIVISVGVYLVSILTKNILARTNSAFPSKSPQILEK